MTVNEVSKLTGLSVRTLHYYDEIGLLKPDNITDAGYRIYGCTAIERIEQILLFRELEFSLKDIKAIINSADFDKQKAINQQIELLTIKKERTEKLIQLAKKIKVTGESEMDFKSFSTEKLDEYKKQAKEKWGGTAEYEEFERKTANQSNADEKKNADDFMQIFAEFGKMMKLPADKESVQRQVVKLQSYITEHFYKCSREVLLCLGEMYSADGEFKKNIDRAGGEGCAAFVSEAISNYCKNGNN